MFSFTAKNVKLFTRGLSTTVNNMNTINNVNAAIKVPTVPLQSLIHTTEQFKFNTKNIKGSHAAKIWTHKFNETNVNLVAPHNHGQQSVALIDTLLEHRVLTYSEMSLVRNKLMEDEFLEEPGSADRLILKKVCASKSAHSENIDYLIDAIQETGSDDEFMEIIHNNPHTDTVVVHEVENKCSVNNDSSLVIAIKFLVLALFPFVAITCCLIIAYCMMYGVNNLISTANPLGSLGPFVLLLMLIILMN